MKISYMIVCNGPVHPFLHPLAFRALSVLAAPTILVVNSTTDVTNHRGRLERKHDLIVGANLTNVAATSTHLAVDLDVRGEHL